MDDRPRYMISVAADLVGMHPQTLRIYEQKGLVRPKRTAGNTRLYSERDLERLRQAVAREPEGGSIPMSRTTLVVYAVGAVCATVAWLVTYPLGTGVFPTLVAWLAFAVLAFGSIELIRLARRRRR